jgi:hypothetical protein
MGSGDSPMRQINASTPAFPQDKIAPILALMARQLAERLRNTDHMTRALTD